MCWSPFQLLIINTLIDLKSNNNNCTHSFKVTVLAPSTLVKIMFNMNEHNQMERSRLEVLKPIILEAGWFWWEQSKYYADCDLFVTWLIRKDFRSFIYACIVEANSIPDEGRIRNPLIMLRLNFDQVGINSVMTHVMVWVLKWGGMSGYDRLQTLVIWLGQLLSSEIPINFIWKE